jgi:aminoglycoside phosphotransferase (APT) family kinase protein
MSTVYPIASRRPQPDLLAHPAALAWSRLCPDSDGPSGISILKQRSKSVIYRMDDAAPDGSAVIAKLCRRQVAAHERIVYDQVLSKIPVSHPRYFGSIEENSECDWLFLEYIEGEPYSRFRDDHSILAGKWLGRLHSLGSRVAASCQLPDRGPGYFLAHLRAARHRLRTDLTSLDLPASQSAVFAAVIAQCNFLEAHWSQVEIWDALLPATFIHADFKPKNAVIRSAPEGPAFFSYDWELSGCGNPAIDIAHVDLSAYRSAAEEFGPHLDPDVLQQTALLGRIYLRLAAFAWESQKMDPRWELSTEHLALYQEEMAAAVATASWERKTAHRRIVALPEVTGEVSCKRPPSANDAAKLMIKTLEVALSRSRERKVNIKKLQRQACEATESFQSERLRASLNNGEVLPVFLKDLNPAHQTEAARKVREFDLAQSYRELHVYQGILSRIQLGTPELYAVRWEPERGIFWLFLEDTGNSRLRECRNFAKWVLAARWAARFHLAIQVLPTPQTAFLPKYDRGHYQEVANQIEQMFPTLQSADSRVVAQALDHFKGQIDWLSALPRTVIHGQYFGRNIMLRPRNKERPIAVIDWETAAFGPGTFDLVSLAAGNWTQKQRDTLYRAYFEECKTTAGFHENWDEFCAELREIELYQALQWIAWWRNRGLSINFGKWIKELSRIMQGYPASL